MKPGRIGYIDSRRIAGFTFPANATPGNGQLVTITDPSTPASGSVRGRWLTMTSTGNKTGTVQTCADAVSLNISGDSTYAYGRRTYVGPSGTPTIQYLCGDVVYIGDPGAGNNVIHICGLDLGVNNGNPPSGRCTFVRAYSHGGAVGSFAWLSSSVGITNLFDFEHMVVPLIAGAVGGNQDIRIRVTVGGTPYYIPLHTA